MPLRLLKQGLLGSEREPRFFPEQGELRDRYDVVIIGGGGHGLACAHYLAKEHGITNVAVLEQGYLGGGNTGRNTTIIRSNYLTPEGVRFYDASLQLFQGLSEELDINLFYSTRGHYTLAHSDEALRTMRWRAEVNRHHGIDSRVVGPDAVAADIPGIDLECGGNHPVMGALYHAPGAVARHDAVAWGYGRAAANRGVEIHQQTRVTGIRTAGGRVTGVDTDRGAVDCGAVVSMVAGSTPRITAMVDLPTPIEIYPLQACVTEPVKPFLDTIVVSGSLHVYLSQSSRGELVMGAAVDPYSLHSTRSSFEFVEGLADRLIDLLPFTARLRVNRQWAGMSDLTPDFAPIMGTTPLDGFYLDAGWGTWGFKATPISGQTMAATVAAGRNHELIEPFRFDRFTDFQLVGEKGAASVGH
ncbi:FAD-dependent oxidoreductase [Aquisalimonas asiatica]|uniref:N-methylglutamate dehydrogenase subunit A n=1 Tax=Aquisalimonas asiatica TaxID=406100 RepID=A0A1H8RYM2_9GAMM|nr:FAD-dependent oxidoreductase [Aquisalimonas asiatica]SEO71759.1 N-methylglutamate dehydrogenase subunit A precursor [Aquisalimonas asiatica]